MPCKVYASTLRARFDVGFQTSEVRDLGLICFFVAYIMMLQELDISQSCYIEPFKTSIYKGFSMAMLNNQMAYNIYIYIIISKL